MTPIHTLILLGLIVGIYSGIMGLGGGTIMIPIMVLALGFTQQKAVATSLAVMIPPVTLLGVIKYYREGQVDVRTALWIAVGVVVGTLIGAIITGWIVKHFGDAKLKLVFACVLTYISGYMLFQTLGKQYLVRSMLFAGVLVVVSFLFFTVVKWYDARNTPPAQSAPANPA
jgi:uncharacterized protein